MWRRAVLAVFCLAACALANRERVDECNFIEVPDGTSGGHTYHFPRLAGPGTVNCSGANMPRCNMSVNSPFLSGRSWYITQTKAYYGQGYNEFMFETYKVQCPEGHYLHLTLQNLQLQGCFGPLAQRDSVTVNTSRGNTGPLCRQADLEDSYLYNGGRGIFLKDGRATIDFCSNENGPNVGFTLRATCINPVLYYNAPGCVSYTFFRDWDPDFVDDILRPFSRVNVTVQPHKRSAEENAMSYENMRNKREKLKEAEHAIEEAKAEMEDKTLDRNKRGIRYFFDLPEGTRITYRNHHLRIVFPNGTIFERLVHCLSTSNDLYGTRTYVGNATRQAGDTTGATEITFTGPGFIDIFLTSSRRRNAILKWTPRISDGPPPEMATHEEEYLEQDIEAQLIAESLYEYIDKQWVSGYVIIDELEAQGLDPRPFPMQGAGGPAIPKSIRVDSQIGVIYPEIQPSSVCRFVIRIEAAPLQIAEIDPDILEFCAFFQFACDSVLATACREIMLLDPFDNPPMAMMPGRD